MAPVSLMFFSVPVRSSACAWPEQSAAVSAKPMMVERFIPVPLSGLCRLLENLAEHRRDVAAKLIGIFAHRKMTELLHDGDTGAGDRGGGPLGIFRRAGEIILAGEQKQRTYFSINPPDPATQVAVDPVEIEVALEDAGTALFVGPQRLHPRRGRALRRNQAGDQRGADFAAMDVGAVEPRGVVPWRLEIGGLEPDQRTEFRGMIDREVEDDAAADRAAHHDRPVEFQRPAEGTDRLRVARRGELIFRTVPVRRRIGFAVPGHVEGDDAEILRERFIGEQMPPLPSVRARGVQAHQRNAGAIFLEVDAVHLAIDIDMDVTADQRLDIAVHDATTTKFCRGSASTSLKYCRLAMNGCR